MKKTIVTSVLALSALTIFPNPAKACFFCDIGKGISDAIDDPGKAIENLGEAILDIPGKVLDPDNWSKAPNQGDPLFPNQNENIGGQSEDYQDGQFNDDNVVLPEKCSARVCSDGYFPDRPVEGGPQSPDLGNDDFIFPDEIITPSPYFNNPSPNRSGFNSSDCPMIQGVKVCHY